MIEQAQALLSQYKRAGYTLTLRGLYYKFVSQDLFPEAWADKKTGSTNNQKSYDKLGELVNDGRLAGLIDWDSMEDITRSLDKNSHWDSPAEIIESSSEYYGMNMWAGQSIMPEIWVEKDAMKGVIARPAEELDVPYFSCRGYVSQTAMWDAANRIRRYMENGHDEVRIFHLGDHDPSGIDMTRDIEERISMFLGRRWASRFSVERIALNMNQVNQYGPPPNPAKISDGRAAKYIEEYGEESWELDALEPEVIYNLITESVEGVREESAFELAKSKLESDKEILSKLTDNWDEIRDHIEETY